ncbi:hypothetical protein CIFRMM251M_26465 [Citrobacter freundii]
MLHEFFTSFWIQPFAVKLTSMKKIVPDSTNKSKNKI